MTLIQAIVLGMVQGLTEFWPISSSAHLILLPRFFGWNEHSLAFDTALHLGTAFAVLLFFRKDWLEIISGFLKRKNSLLLFLLLGSIPAGVVGALFESFFERTFRSSLAVATFLVPVAIIMWVADRTNKSNGTNRTYTLRDSLVVGFSQALALFPGVSRSGITISAARWRGFSRGDAARFSFLLSTPIVLAAGFYKVGKLALANGQMAWGNFLVGALVSFGVGFLAIRFLMKILKTHSLLPFVIYRLLLAVAILLLLV